MSRAAVPIASAPLEHEETVVKFGPVAPKIIESCPGAISASIIGKKKGLTLWGPWDCKTSYWFEMVMIPPTPLPIITATLCPSLGISRWA